jgi:hypothetical protein
MPASKESLTRAWAEALYERNPDAQGLFWTSRMQNRAQSFMLFGTRVHAPKYLRPVGAPHHLRQPDGTKESQDGTGFYTFNACIREIAWIIDRRLRSEPLRCCPHDPP